MIPVAQLMRKMFPWCYTADCPSLSEFSVKASSDQWDCVKLKGREQCPEWERSVTLYYMSLNVHKQRTTRGEMMCDILISLLLEDAKSKTETVKNTKLHLFFNNGKNV